MLCPSCENTLQKLSITTNSGGRFDINHCGRCGGTWFDPYEINRIPYHEVVRLAHLTVLPKTQVKQPERLLCPACHKQLSPYQGDAVPKDVQLLFCPRCLGIWATQESLWEFKKFQEATIEEYKVGDKIFPKLSVVFIPTISIIFLFLTTFISISHFAQLRDSRIKAQNLIQNLAVNRPSEDTILVSFTTTQEVKSKIKFGPTVLELEEVVISKSFTTVHNAIITNLIPQQKYMYMLVFEDKTGKEFSTELKLLKLGK